MKMKLYMVLSHNIFLFPIWYRRNHSLVKNVYGSNYLFYSSDVWTNASLLDFINIRKEFQVIMKDFPIQLEYLLRTPHLDWYGMVEHFS